MKGEMGLGLGWDGLGSFSCVRENGVNTQAYVEHLSVGAQIGVWGHCVFSSFLDYSCSRY